MAAPIVAVGSMMVKGVFKAGGLLSGLSSMGSKLKEAKQRSKSTSTEMKRMTGHTKALGAALTGISIAGFTALMMSAPQLAGSLAKIKTELTLMAYAVGAKLKPALDAVGTILRGIRTGDWTVVKQGIASLTTSLIALVGEGYTIIVDTIFGEGTAAKTKEAFTEWVAGIQKAWDEGTAFDVAKAIIWPPVKWLYDETYKLFNDKVFPWANERGKNFGQNIQEEGLGEAMRGMWGIGKIMQLTGYDVLAARKERINNRLIDEGKWRGGVKTYKYGAEEPEKVVNINVTFDGATINATTEAEVSKLADLIAYNFAIRQQSVTI